MTQTNHLDAQYYLAIAGQTVGPWPLPAIAERLARGELPPETMLWDGTAWCGCQEFSPLAELCRAWPVPVAAVGAAMEPESGVPQVTASESAPAPESARGGVSALPVLPVCLPQTREKALLPDWHRPDPEPVTVSKRGLRQFGQIGRAVLSGGLAVTVIPWPAVVLGLVAAAVFGYLGKLYMVLTVGSGFAVGLGLFLSVRVKWVFRLAVALFAWGAGLAAWWMKIGV